METKNVYELIRIAVQQVAESNRLTLTMSGRANPVELRIRISLKEGGMVETERDSFEKYCFRYRLPTDAYGKEFTIKGVTYKLIGIKKNRPRFPFIGERLDGKRFKFPFSCPQIVTLMEPLPKKAAG